MQADIAVDSCVLIEFFRARDKSQTLYRKLKRQNGKIAISTIVLYEVLAGLTPTNRTYWETFLKKIVLLPFDKREAEVAADLSTRLRKNRIQLASSDLFIAATALAHDLPLATLNRKHFQRIDDLKLV